MAGAIEKKKNETFDELEGSPTTHIDARSSILSEIALSREFAQTFLHALCKKFTSSSGDYSARNGRSRHLSGRQPAGQCRFKKRHIA